MKLIHALIPALMLTAAATGVSAKVIASGTSAGNGAGAGFTVNNTPIPLNGAATTLSFNSAKAGRFVLTFSAECSADTGTTTASGWTEIDVEVNGVIVAPTVGSSDAFCSPNNTAGHDSWIRPSITLPVTLVAGANTVRVLGKFVAPVTSGWLADTAIVIHD